MQQKTFLLIGLFTVFGIIFFSGCVNQVIVPETLTGISLDNSFQLKINQTAVIESENLEITFLSVVSDSRCPVDVTCFLEGEAVVVINVLKAGQNFGDFNLSTNEIMGGLKVVNFDNYFLKLLDVKPYPGTPEARFPEHTVTLVVSKQ
ncbi:MAG: hypothetical protein ABH821_04345 [archaeon]